MNEFTSRVVEKMKEFNLEGMTLKDFLKMHEAKPKGVAIVLGHAPGALPNGSRVKKINSLGEKDTHQDGATASIIGSMGPVSGVYAYFVFWDDVPNIPCFIAGNRLEMIPREHNGKPQGDSGWCDAPDCWCAYPNLTPGLTEEEIITRTQKGVWKCK